jgi:hypothetical protein
MNHYLTIERAAQGYKVKATDVLSWIEAGKIRAEMQEDGTYRIPIEEYQRFGSSMPAELMEKLMQNMWEGIEKVQPQVQENVRQRFLQNSQHVLDRVEQAIALLEEIHKKHEPGVDLEKDKRGAVAAFIVFARIISLMYSITALLRSGVPAESIILFRPLWEATLLAKYFAISDALGHNENTIRRWFEKQGEIVGAQEVREYLSKNTKFPIELMRKLNKIYSWAIHHTHDSIMESYRGYSMSGMGAKFQRRLGFDYHASSVGRDLVSTIEAFEGLVTGALHAFVLCFQQGLNEEEMMRIKIERDFYSLEFSERLSQIFGSPIQGGSDADGSKKSTKK